MLGVRARPWRPSVEAVAPEGMITIVIWRHVYLFGLLSRSSGSLDCSSATPDCA